MPAALAPLAGPAAAGIRPAVRARLGGYLAYVWMALLPACSAAKYGPAGAHASDAPQLVSVKLSPGASARVRVVDARFNVHPTGGACAMLELQSRAITTSEVRLTYTWLDRLGLPVGPRDDLGKRVQLSAGKLRWVTQFASMGPTVAGYRVYIDVP